MSVFAAPGAYDRAITVFSPDGRLFQVEYAMELVNRGATILGIQTAEGVVLGSEESIEALEEVGFSYKIFRVDDHVGAAIVGLSSDARILIDQARVHSQSNKLTYDEPIDVEVVTKRICDLQQMYTQHAGVRPFGVSLIFAGVDKTGSRVFGTHPSGTYRGYKATALGAGRETVLNILKEEYKDNMSLEGITKLAIKCLVKALEARQLPPRIKLAVIPAATKTLEMLSDEKIDAYIKELSSSK
ncbi:MAG: archaeal proteasome endopeptidase complex subunit alpha [Nitrososphaerota archaeon]|jgi:proteasome alpha subunit|nr:archaeal proteasome endopeptidase complex subunit alpha [Nitrososphaerota archaeon]